MSNLSNLLWLSVAIQCVAAILALRLIPITGRSLAWILLSITFLLMAARRALSLMSAQGLISDSWMSAFSVEFVALIISVLTVMGVILIRRIFVQQYADAEKIRVLSQAVEQNPGVTIITGIDGKINYVNSSYCILSGKVAEDVIGTIPDVLNPKLVDELALRDIWDTLKSGRIWQGELNNKYNDGHLRWERACISPVKGHNSKITHYVIALDDVTKQKEQRDQLQYMALHDSLTDLPNRTLFNDRLKQAILAAQRDKARLAVMLMDINNFKVINDTMGHLVGDIILKEISTRMLEITRGGDTVARMGGDEFLFLLPDAKHSEQLEFIKRISAILATPFIVGDKSFDINASIGLALFPDDGEDPETLLKSADVAMYSAKSSAETYKRYDKRLDAGNVSRLELSNSLRTAIEKNQFVLHYQPIVNYATGSIDSAEALIRWNHPERGLLSPDNFIPLAEQTFHIGAITQWVLKTALQDLASWQKKGLETGVSINISAQDLLDPSLSKNISTELESNHIAASQVTIEITESSLMMHTYQTLQNLNKLRSIGVKIHIDDFGTGYSSLRYLTKFPVTGLKIDKAFVMNMTSDDNDAIIVRSTTDLAHNMGLTVVAEGIEKQEIYDVIEILGCDYAQGYLIAKPMTAAALVAWLQKWKTVSHRSGVRASVL